MLGIYVVQPERAGAVGRYRPCVGRVLVTHHDWPVGDGGTDARHPHGLPLRARVPDHDRDGRVGRAQRTDAAAA